jgi:protein involved in polysaccharide export with SLBB domain
MRYYQGLLWICLTVLSGGCSTLGLSLYPSGPVLTGDAERMLRQSRVPAGVPRENAATVLDTHILQPGETLLIESHHPESDLRIPADQVILADGTVDLGAYGRVVVAGSDLEAAEALIETQIAEHLQKQKVRCTPSSDAPSESPSDDRAAAIDCNRIAINVRLLEPVHRYYVLGAVNAPGVYRLSGHETVLDGILEAGGLSETAHPCKLLLARATDPCECRVVLPICYRDIVQLGSTASNYQLRPGDRIFVASRSFCDDLKFWEAKTSCRACGSHCGPRPSVLPRLNPIAVLPRLQINPGSAAWWPWEKDPLGSDNAAPQQDLPDAGPAPVNRLPVTPLGDTESLPAELPAEPQPNFDGELDLPTLDSPVDDR